MSGRAIDVIAAADVIVGYTTYIVMIEPLISGKTVIATGMRKEVERVRQAVEKARQGMPCALVCSGDPGIYAMAGLVFELCRENRIPLGSSPDGLTIEVVPGIPALAAGAALLGAPLMHDFAAVSLSDLLTPWPVIEKRIRMAAEADFVLAIYNPRSRKRDWQLGKAKEILLEYRSPDTPAGIVTSAMRAEESVHIRRLADLRPSAADMQSTVFVGNSTSYIFEGRMVTPRGYRERYELAISREHAGGAG
jgi:precorrin-3B C17-methyltransferase